jgi:hypothetical protein
MPLEFLPGRQRTLQRLGSDRRAAVSLARSGELGPTTTLPGRARARDHPMFEEPRELPKDVQAELTTEDGVPLDIVEEELPRPYDPERQGESE